MLRRGAWLLAALALCLTASRLGRQVPRLLEGKGPAGVDVEMRRVATQAWYRGEIPYQRPSENYPPATYLMLGPVIGWASAPAARVVWAILLLSALAATSWCAWRLAAPAPAGWRAFAAVLPWAAFPTAYAFSYGQMGPICLAAGMGALLLAPGKASLRRETAAGILHTVSLIKPSYSLPWVAALVVRADRRRTFALTAAFYLALTLAAVALVSGPMRHRLLGWLGSSSRYLGYGNLTEVMVRLGAPQLVLPAGALLLAIYLVWSRLRSPDPLTEWAVGAIVARCFVYHNIVDDGLLLAPMLVMIRHLGERLAAARAVAPVLAPLALGCAAMFVPTRWQAAGGGTEIALKALVMSAFAAALLYFLSVRPRRPAR